MAATGLRSAGMTALRRVRSALGGCAVVLTYHRVADLPLDPQALAVSPARFEEHVAAFAERYELMSAGDLMRRLAEGRRLPRNGLVITLDDGYADALTGARPVLAAHGAPATVFVASGFITQPREFWWDELERLALTAPSLPERIDLTAVAVDFARTLDAAGRGLPVAPAGSGPFDGWDVTKPAAHPREQLYTDLAEALNPLSPADRERVLDELRTQTGAPREMRDRNRPLTADELGLLADGGLVEIGAHTVNHVRLSALSPEEQRREILGSKAALEEVLGREVVSFSYPYGNVGSFTDETEALVREAGFLGAVTTQLGGPLPWGSVSRGSDRFALPRTHGGDVPIGQLLALIDKRLGL